MRFLAVLFAKLNMYMLNSAVSVQNVSFLVSKSNPLFSPQTKLQVSIFFSLAKIMIFYHQAPLITFETICCQKWSKSWWMFNSKKRSSYIYISRILIKLQNIPRQSWQMVKKLSIQSWQIFSYVAIPFLTRLYFTCKDSLRKFNIIYQDI